MLSFRSALDEVRSGSSAEARRNRHDSWWWFVGRLQSIDYNSDYNSCLGGCVKFVADVDGRWSLIVDAVLFNHNSPVRRGREGEFVNLTMKLLRKKIA